MEVLNDAIDRLVNEKLQNEWEPVNVAVAPSTITISELDVRSIVTPEFSFICVIDVEYSNNVECFFITDGKNDHRVSSKIFIVLGNRQGRENVRLHYAHGARSVCMSRVSLRAVLGYPL